MALPSSKVKLNKRHTEILADEAGVPPSVAISTMVVYRSVGIGIFGVFMRCAGMPLEKIALYMNSSQVSGKGQLAQSIRLTFKDGLLTPYRVVGPASLVAWFFQYSVMGFAFQFFDSTLSSLMGAQPVYYGPELMKPAPKKSEAQPSSVVAANVVKTALAPLLSGSLESLVANRAEVERYYGRQQFKQIESNLNWGGLAKFCGPGYFANASRNVVMCSTTFVLTPITYKLYFPQEKKSKTTLFWYGLGMNIFAGNVIAITQQALWGRALDYGAVGGGRPINYEAVVREGLKKEGISAFFTPAKWFSRVLMNAPAQGALPWYYNEILPMGEHKVLQLVKKLYGIR